MFVVFKCGVKIFVKMCFEDKYTESNTCSFVPPESFESFILVKYVDVESISNLKIENKKFCEEFMSAF